jgi:hypothetical protein
MDRFKFFPQMDFWSVYKLWRFGGTLFYFYDNLSIRVHSYLPPPPHVLSESSVGEIWFMIWRLLSLYRFQFRMSFICIYIRFRDLKKSSWSWIWYHSLSFLRQFMWEGGPIIIYLYRVSSLGYCLVLIYSWFPH